MKGERKAVVPGDEFDVVVIRWDDGWEFDCPTVVLSPRLHVYEDGRSVESAVEDFLTGVVVDEALPRDYIETEGRWAGYVGRRWTVSALRQRRRRIEKGQSRGTIHRVRVRLVIDEYCDLSWEAR